jgi:hypothetical protein
VPIHDERLDFHDIAPHDPEVDEHRLHRVADTQPADQHPQPVPRHLSQGLLSQPSL